MGIQGFKSEQDAKILLETTRQALEKQFGFIPETNESEKFYMIIFMPREKFIRWYVDYHTDPYNGILFNKDKSCGYKGCFYYLDNVKPDSNLSNIGLFIDKMLIIL